MNSKSHLFIVHESTLNDLQRKNRNSTVESTVATISTDLSLFAWQSAHKFADDVQHNFIGAAGNRQETKIAVRSADQHLLTVAHGSVELQTAVHQLPGQAAAFQLEHARMVGHILAVPETLCRLITERLEQLQLGLQFGQSKMNRLVIDDWPAERFSLPTIIDCGVQNRLEGTDA